MEDKFNYCVTYDWMLVFGLSGNALMAYSLIYGFSKKEGKWFCGTAGYIAQWFGGSKKTAYRVLDRLTGMGLLEKRSEGGSTEYRAVMEMAEKAMECKRRDKMTHPIQENKMSTPPAVKMSDIPTAKMSGYNNNSKNINRLYNTSIYAREEESLFVHTPEEEKKKPRKEKKKEYAKGVRLTETEHEKLVKEYGADITAKAIEYLSLYKQDKYYRNKSDYLSIRRWTINAVTEKKDKKKRGTSVMDAVRELQEEIWNS